MNVKQSQNNTFAARVSDVVSQIPIGRVMTYGQIAALCGNARASRIVGGLAHFGDPDLPWQRVVNKAGGLASGYPGGREGHKKDLEAEGVVVLGSDGDYSVNVNELIWSPMGSKIEDRGSKNNAQRSTDISIKLPRSPVSDLRSLYIVGPTASGKTALSIELARYFGGEIVSADSQIIRKEMNIGTAKPSLSEQEGIPHHMLDVIEPYEPYSLRLYLEQARAHIADIHARSKVAIVVGGTGLYVDALYYNFTLPEIQENVGDYSGVSVEQLQAMINDRGLSMPTNERNPRHLINTLKRADNVGRRSPPSAGSVIVGINPPRELLIERINARAEKMFEDGFVVEVSSIIERYGKGEFDAIGYKIVAAYLRGEYSEGEAKELFKIAHRQYAKRQMSWFKRNKDIVWFDSPVDAKQFILSAYGS